ncbi:MAG: DNA-directed RNA polymerase subunit omega [Bacteroidetes bacterium]|nr:DNA-directed RNA polymerase subunit omega [Bacteroidota bacterium]
MAKPKAPLFPNVSTTTIPRDMKKLEGSTENVYEAITIIAKRANQVGAKLKEELQNQMQEYVNDSDNLEEVHENRDQIELSMAYEKLPKPTLIATDEFLNGKVYHRNPARDDQK